MTSKKPRRRRAIPAAAAVIVTACAGALSAAPASAAPTVTFTAGVLTIDGDAANNGLIVSRTSARTVTLNGSEVLGGTVAVGDVRVVRMDGGDGDDNLRFDERNGVMPRGEFVGGEGRDKLIGGSQADSLRGGNGIDRSDGGPGDDTVTLGDGSDEFTWNPGDGNDHVDGDAGKDTLLFNGSDRTAADAFESEAVSFDDEGSRSTIRRLVGRPFPLPIVEDIVSISGFELVKARLAGGPNAVFFDRAFSGSDVGLVRVDLGPPTDPVRDLAPNSAAFVGSAGADQIRIGGSPATGATITGLGPAAIITGAELFVVQGGGGDDVIDASLLADGTVGLLEEVGGSGEEPGDDTLIGHAGSDRLSGGGGDDRLEGRGGDDILDGGPGNNVILP